ncbi:MAG: hypothetical protein ACJAQ0_001219 [Dasania sp.]|jgi:hypothetical protein
MGAIIYNVKKGHWEKTGFWGNKDLGYESIRVKALMFSMSLDVTEKTALTQHF